MDWELDKGEQAWFKHLLTKYNKVMVCRWRNKLVVKGIVTGKIIIPKHLKLLFIVKQK